MNTPGLESYKLYSALNLHFKLPDFDAPTYNFKTRVNEDTVKQSPFRWAFAKLDKDYFIDNQMRQELCFKFLLVKQKVDFGYLHPKKLFFELKKQKSVYIDDWIDYNFKSDLIHLSDKYKEDKFELFKTNSLYPELHQCVILSEIDVLTASILSMLIHNVYSEGYSKDIVSWKDICHHQAKLQSVLGWCFNTEQRQKIEDLFKTYYLEA